MQCPVKIDESSFGWGQKSPGKQHVALLFGVSLKILGGGAAYDGCRAHRTFSFGFANVLYRRVGARRAGGACTNVGVRAKSHAPAAYESDYQ